MATQFYRTLDDIMRLKQENTERIQARVAELTENTSRQSYDSELAALKANLRTMGVSNQDERSIEDGVDDKSKRLQFIRENNIQPGTPRWFKVMYARPELTGEDPYGE